VRWELIPQLQAHAQRFDDSSYTGSLNNLNGITVTGNLKLVSNAANSGTGALNINPSGTATFTSTTVTATRTLAWHMRINGAGTVTFADGYNNGTAAVTSPHQTSLG
jgi:hypothetical protein